MTQFKNQETKDVKVGYIETENYCLDIGATDPRVLFDGSYEPLAGWENSRSGGALWFKGNKLNDYDGGPIPKEVKEAIKYMGYEL
jgi:hypothetical protein